MLLVDSVHIYGERQPPSCSVPKAGSLLSVLSGTVAEVLIFGSSGDDWWLCCSGECLRLAYFHCQ